MLEGILHLLKSGRALPSCSLFSIRAELNSYWYLRSSISFFGVKKRKISLIGDGKRRAARI